MNSIDSQPKQHLVALASFRCLQQLAKAEINNNNLKKTLINKPAPDFAVKSS